MIYFSGYEQAKNKKEKFSTATFFYSYYSKELNYLINFEITVDHIRIFNQTQLYLLKSQIVLQKIWTVIIFQKIVRLELQ